MKRAISLLVAIVMIVSMIPNVFATSETAIIVEDIAEIAVELNADNGYYAEYSWTPSEDGELSLYQYTEKNIEVMLMQGDAFASSYVNDEDGAYYGFAVSLPVVAGEEVIIEVVNSEEADESFVMEGYFYGAPGKSIDNPIKIDGVENVVTNSGTLYYSGFFNGAEMVITGEGEFVVTVNDQAIAAQNGVVSFAGVGTPNVIFAITGEGDFTVRAVYPVGTQMNPEALFRPAYIVVNVAEGNDQGYYYKWQSQEKGTLTLTCPEVEGVPYNVILTNMTTYAQGWLSDSTDGTVSVDVAPNQEVQIQVVVEPDENFNYPALQTALTGAFEINDFGTSAKPEVIDDLSWYYGFVSQAQGAFDGYYYTWTAAGEGVATFYFASSEQDLTGYTMDIVVTNVNTGAQMSLLNDGVDNFGMELQVPVAAGDQLVIMIYAVQDAEGNFAPAADMSWTGNFAAPQGTESNPIATEWIWNDEYTDATATVTVAAGETVYFTGNSGMILTVNGVVTEQNAEGAFVITNSGDAEATYELALATPVGAYANPEIIEIPFKDTNSLAQDGAYYYIYTATEDVTLVLDVTDGANITADVLTYVEDSEWPISEQFALAEPEIDENWNYTGWIVAENLTIDVKAGQIVKIQVNGLTDWENWSTPAVDYTLTVEAEVKEAAAITVQPEDVAVDSGENAVFHVEATGEVVSYKWQYRKIYTWFNTTMEGFDTDTLTVAAKGRHNNYDYKCIITFADGTVLETEPAKLTVQTTLTITYHPNDQLVALGYKGQFTAKATGEGLKFVWQYCRPGSEDWAETQMEGNDKETVMIETTERRNGYMYRCKITDVTGNVAYTDVATMTVLSVAEQPQDVFTAPDKNVTFTVAGNVSEGYKYQWEYFAPDSDRWIATSMDGATTATLTVPAKLKRDGYQYRCVLTGDKNSKVYSEPATLHVGMETEITAQPQSVEVAAGTTATFTVEATNVYSYKWQYSKNGTDWYGTDMTGATTATLTVTATAKRNGYQYRCKIVGIDGTTLYTDVATLTVK